MDPRAAVPALVLGMAAVLAAAVLINLAYGDASDVSADYVVRCVYAGTYAKYGSTTTPAVLTEPKAVTIEPADFRMPATTTAYTLSDIVEDSGGVYQFDLATTTDPHAADLRILPGAHVDRVYPVRMTATNATSTAYLDVGVWLKSGVCP